MAGPSGVGGGPAFAGSPAASPQADKPRTVKMEAQGDGRDCGMQVCTIDNGKRSLHYVAIVGDGSAAEVAGITRDEVLVAVNGTNASGLNRDRMLQLLSKRASLKLQLRRPTVDEQEAIKCDRAGEAPPARLGGESSKRRRRSSKEGGRRRSSFFGAVSKVMSLKRQSSQGAVKVPDASGSPTESDPATEPEAEADSTVMDSVSHQPSVPPPSQPVPSPPSPTAAQPAANHDGSPGETVALRAAPHPGPSEHAVTAQFPHVAPVPATAFDGLARGTVLAPAKTSARLRSTQNKFVSARQRIMWALNRLNALEAMGVISSPAAPTNAHDSATGSIDEESTVLPQSEEGAVPGHGSSRDTDKLPWQERNKHGIKASAHRPNPHEYTLDKSLRKHSKSENFGSATTDHDHGADHVAEPTLQAQTDPISVSPPIAPPSPSRVFWPSKKKDAAVREPGDVASGAVLPPAAAAAAPDTYGESRVGRKKAVIIAVSYFGTDRELPVCLKDAYSVQQLLIDPDRGGLEPSMVRMVNEADITDASCRPTKANIMSALQWLVAGVAAGDQLFLYINGHGSQIEDKVKGKVGCLLPLDFQRDNTSTYIAVDEVFDTVVRPLPPGAALDALFDCSRTGTLLGLPWTWDGAKWDQDNVRLDNGGRVVSLSAGQNDEDSAETEAFDHTNGGVLTRCWLDVATKCGTYHDVFTSVADEMDKEMEKTDRFPQRTVLACSEQLDLNTDFALFAELTPLSAP